MAGRIATLLHAFETVFLSIRDYPLVRCHTVTWEIIAIARREAGKEQTQRKMDKMICDIWITVDPI